MRHEGDNTAGTVSKIRGSVRAVRSSWSIDAGSCKFNCAKSSVTLCVIAGRGLSQVEGRGFSRFSAGLCIH